MGLVRRALLALLAAVLVAPPLAAAAPPPGQPGSPEYLAHDLKNIADAYGRQTGQQLADPDYLPSLIFEANKVSLNQLADQVANLTRPAITPGNLVPGWNAGNPLRAGWNGTRGIEIPVSWENRYGALIRGHVFAPKPGARDPYTGRTLSSGRLPGVVITTGSVQGSERMYFWLAQDLAERGYTVLTYDVQGQGTSGTFPHEGPVNGLPFCNPFAEPRDLEQFGCPGVPFQQPANFVHGTTDALDFFTSDANPLRGKLDPSRIGIAGHSLGAAAVSYVQGADPRVKAVVALDKLDASGDLGVEGVTPRVPALAVQSEYGFTVAPYWLNGGSSLVPTPTSPLERPDPRREQKTGFDAWRAKGVDTMLIVPRASTHLDYTDLPLVLPASRYGQALTSVYAQAWFDRHLRGDTTAERRLLATRHTYLEPQGNGAWAPIVLDRDALLSTYFCSGYDFRTAGGGRARDLDPGRVGGC
ncbi:MAG TPA: hypothetical protein VN238_10925 [Solirubrobacteraceae bacterium]|nr:hypothetical protein [Solirubrobacteraceae bacterium]